MIQEPQAHQPAPPVARRDEALSPIRDIVNRNLAAVEQLDINRDVAQRIILTPRRNTAPRGEQSWLIDPNTILDVVRRDALDFDKVISDWVVTTSSVFFSCGGGVLEIRVNGEPREIAGGTTIAALLEQLGMQPRYLAVERNFELVPRTGHADCTLQAGDQIEIVTLVGGG